MTKSLQTKSTLFTLVLIVMGLISTQVFADVVPTTVTVGNTAPVFDVDTTEPSTGANPTRRGTAVVFQATATDASGENYYLAICQTDAITPVNGGAPTCPGGAWIVSSATTSGAQATANYFTFDATEVNDWYSFVCDGNASNALCSEGYRDAPNPEGEFYVNHVPTFTAASNDGPVNPGGMITFTTTASDSDVEPSQDQVRLVVCKTAGIQSSGACTGGGGATWCNTALTNSNPTCAGTVSSVQPHGTLDAYVYVLDNHNFQAAFAGIHGDNISFSVNDVAPSVTAITLNAGSDITLNEGSTIPVSVTATVSDANSCQDITSVTTSIYRSGITYAGCDTNPEDNNNNCYAVVTCNLTGGTCSGPADGSADYTCSASIQYHADPTDATTEYPAENWLSTVIGTDGSTSVNTQIGTGVEVLSLIGYDVAGSINYGSLTVGQSNDPLDRTTNVSATGNVGLDIEVSGTNMADGGNTIAVGNQEYALAISTAYGAGTDLTTSATESEINIAKTTVTSTDENADVYWGLLIPGGTQPGSYTGTNTITALKGEVGQW